MASAPSPVNTFRLAPMSSLILGLTLGLLALPVVFLTTATLWRAPLLIPAGLLAALYAWVWLRFRPTRFVVSAEALDVVWPLRRRTLPRGGITAVRLVDPQALRREVGWCMRIGAGGLWGGFGWLWTRRRGIVQMYVSRTEGLVWIERAGSRPWLITPERPEAFVRALSREPMAPAAGTGAVTTW